MRVPSVRTPRGARDECAKEQIVDEQDLAVVAVGVRNRARVVVAMALGRIEDVVEWAASRANVPVRELPDGVEPDGVVKHDRCSAKASERNEWVDAEELEGEVDRMEAVCIEHVQPSHSVVHPMEWPEGEIADVEQPVCREAANLSNAQRGEDLDPERLRFPPLLARRTTDVRRRSGGPHRHEPARSFVHQGED